jgi:hypothetical protein
VSDAATAIGKDGRMPTVMPLALFGIVAAVAPVTIDGAACLDAGDIEAALQGLLPDGAARGPFTVQLLPSAAALVVRVRNRDGELTAERNLPPLAAGELSCRQRAQEIAVVVAASAVPEGPAPTPVMTSTGPLEPPAPQVADLTAHAPQSPPRAFDVGVAAGASLAAGVLAPAVRVEAAVPASSALLVRLSGLYDGEHREDVGRGQAAWSRWGAACAFAVRRTVGTSGLEVAAAAQLATTWLAISGRGFTETVSSWAFDPGAGAEARLSWRGRRLSSWLAVGGMAWPRPQGVFVRGIGGEGEIPRWDLFAGIGGAFRTR